MGPVCTGISNSVFAGGKALLHNVKTLGNMLNQKEIEGAALPVRADCAVPKHQLFDVAKEPTLVAARDIYLIIYMKFHLSLQ